MSKAWCPVINYCIDGCKGCSTLCPSGAIEYIGDVASGCCSGSVCYNC